MMAFIFFRSLLMTNLQNPEYYLFSRWGHTGINGQCKLEGGEKEAESYFARAFELKMGV